MRLAILIYNTRFPCFNRHTTQQKIMYSLHYSLGACPRISEAKPLSTEALGNGISSNEAPTARPAAKVSLTLFSCSHLGFSFIYLIVFFISSFIDFDITAGCTVMFEMRLSSLRDSQSYFKLEKHNILNSKIYISDLTFLLKETIKRVMCIDTSLLHHDTSSLLCSFENK